MACATRPALHGAKISKCLLRPCAGKIPRSGSRRKSAAVACSPRPSACSPSTGYNGAKTKDIAREAGVNEALLFRHFPTKEDLYAAILAEKADRSRLDALLQVLDEHAGRRDDWAFFEEVARQVLHWYRSEPEFLRLMLFSALERHQLAKTFRDSHRRPVHEAMERYVALRQRERAFRAMRPATAIRSFIGMIAYHAMQSEIFDDHTAGMSNKEAVASFTTLFLAGMQAEPAAPRDPA